MKVAIALSFAGLVGASDFAMFKDAGCMEALTEYKTNGGTVKNEWSTHVIPFSTGECREFDPVIEWKRTPDGGDASTSKIKYSYGTSCSEYGNAQIAIFGSAIKDCITDDKTTNGLIGTDDDKDNWAVRFGKMASYCTLEEEDWDIETPTKPKEEERYYVVHCNPNNGSVAGIILGTVALVLSLVGIALAGLAMSKKGSGSPPPAKPAAPAAPAGEAAPQGSTTAAAAVGAATEA